MEQTTVENVEVAAPPQVPIALAKIPEPSIPANPITVMSFDIGIKNLAVCVLTMAPDQTKVHLWRVISVVSKNEAVPVLELLYPKLFKVLDDLMDECNSVHNIPVIDYALVENQPVHKNPTMKSVQMMIYSYFALRGYQGDCVNNVAICSATSKLKGHNLELPPLPPNVKGYQRLKQTAVQYCKGYCQFDKALMATILSYTKQDDICDSLLQAMSWVRRHFPDRYAVTRLASAIPEDQLPNPLPEVPEPNPLIYEIAPPVKKEKPKGKKKKEPEGLNDAI